MLWKNREKVFHGVENALEWALECTGEILPNRPGKGEWNMALTGSGGNVQTAGDERFGMA